MDNNAYKFMDNLSNMTKDEALNRIKKEFWKQRLVKSYHFNTTRFKKDGTIYVTILFGKNFSLKREYQFRN